MHRLILVKHSLPEISSERPRREWPLSDEGRSRCLRLAERLRAYGPARIWTSPEPKAHGTATAVAAALGAAEGSVQVIDALREHDDRGVPFLGETSFRAAVAEFFARPAEAVFGPETADEAYRRFAAAVDGLPAPTDGSASVIVAHGRVISLFVARRAHLDPFDVWGRLGLPSFAVLVGEHLLEIVESVGVSRPLNGWIQPSGDASGADVARSRSQDTEG